MDKVVQDNMLFTWAWPKTVPHISHGEGVYMVTTDGKKIMDFNSQAMCSHHGHTMDPRIIQRVVKQMEEIAYVYPGVGVTPIRVQLTALLRDMFPGDLNTFTFPSSGAEAVEAALRAARIYTGRHKVFSSYRSYHGGTLGAMAVTGDQRRWTSEPGDPSVVKMMPPQPYSLSWGETEEEITSKCLTLLKEQLMYEGPTRVAAIIVESVVGTNGVVKPPAGYLEGVRALCDEYGIVMICDEVMAGFGRTGKLFGFMHSPGVVPDMVTFAKGVNGAYLPLGGLALRDPIADFFRKNPNTGYGSTYNAHPAVLASAHEALLLLMEKDLVGNAKRLEPVMIECMEAIAAKHPSVKQCRAMGLFGIFDIQKNRKGDFIADVIDPLPPAMAAFKKALYDDGLFTLARGHVFYTNPPLVITEEELRWGFSIIDKNLTILDEAMED
uniref:Aspartate aminotransferase family protein n=1 Tax=Eutreptiella gymnastica TaxID=73025 RepID=A0A7S4LDJ6_9EUGL